MTNAATDDREGQAEEHGQDRVGLVPNLEERAEVQGRTDDQEHDQKPQKGFGSAHSTVRVRRPRVHALRSPRLVYRRTPCGQGPAAADQQALSTSPAARSPERTAPSMLPCHMVAVSVPAQ